MHIPTKTHWMTIKWVLRCLKQTIYRGLFLNQFVFSFLCTYANIDWVGDHDNYICQKTIIGV